MLPVTQANSASYGAHADAGAYWRNLANTIEQSVCGGDAVLCQITSTTYYCCHRMVNRDYVITRSGRAAANQRTHLLPDRGAIDTNDCVSSDKL